MIGRPQIHRNRNDKQHDEDKDADFRGLKRIDADKSYFENAADFTSFREMDAKCALMRMEVTISDLADNAVEKVLSMLTCVNPR